MSPFELGCWEVLKELPPHKENFGTHIIELIYHVGERVFHVYFEINDAEPCQVLVT